MIPVSKSLLPPNAAPLQRAFERACRDEVVALNLGPKYRALWSPTTCPAGILPWLAWSLHVDEWDENWTEEQKRATIAASVEVHKKKGTIGALKTALQALGYEVTVDENTGEVFTFRLNFDLNQTGALTTGTFVAARRVAMANKNARSKLLAIRSKISATAGVYGAVAHARAQKVTVDAGTYDFSITASISGAGSYDVGDPVALTVAASASMGTLTFAWALDGVTDSETSATKEFEASEGLAGTWTCVVSNGYSSTTLTAVVGVTGMVDTNTLLLVQVDEFGNIIERVGNWTETINGTVIVDSTTTLDGYGSIRNTASGFTVATGDILFETATSVSAPFTIEASIKPLVDTASIHQAFIGTGVYSWAGTWFWNSGMSFLTWSSHILSAYVSGFLNSTGISISDLAWHHVALVAYSSTSWKVFVDGAVVNTGTTSLAAFSRIRLGRGENSDHPRTPCCIENVRISNIARYTENYTPQARF